MKLTGVSEKVFLDRYSLKDKEGAPLEKTPDEMWKRVADAVAEAETDGRKRSKWASKFYEALQGFKYVPGGRILAGAGTGYSVTFYNCFVIPSPKDSREGILHTLSEMVEIMAHGGGVGINLSSLRPKGFRVKKVNGFSSGPCNWAELFSLATKDIIQQGGTRRGALMLMLWDWHPDIEEFITVKQDLSRINGANLSVCVSDDFMDAVKNDDDWPLVFPDLTDPEYDAKWNGDIEAWKEMGKKVIVRKVIKAREMWDMIAQAAWRSAEPGVVFMQRYNKLHNNYYWNRINCVNPCGEEGLPPYGVCNLGSINLSAFVKGDDINKPGEFDFATLRETVHTAVRFQDNVVDMDPYIFEGIRKMQLEGERRIGLGTMGLGDTLIKLHLRYGSDEAIKFVSRVYKMIRDESYRVSVKLAREKGVFPKFDNKLYPKSGFIQQLPKDLQDDIKKHGIRNSVLLMQAPTGSTSLMAGTTSGIEPVYEFEFIRRDRLGTHAIRHHLYDEWVAKNRVGLESGEIEKPVWFASANDLTPEDHVKIQAVIQQYVDASISKTVNAPKTHTVEDVKKLYNMAYELGCKGVTYMRDGSRPGVLERKEKDSEKKIDPKTKVVPRPMIAHGSTYKMHTPVGTAYITINAGEDDDPLEVFINGVGKAGSDLFAMAEGLGRMISLILRIHSNLTPKEKIRKVVDELAEIGGSSVQGFGKHRVRSLPDAVAKALSMKYGLNGFGAHHDKDVENTQKLNGHAKPNGLVHLNGNGLGHMEEQRGPQMSTEPTKGLQEIQSAEVAIAVPKENTHFDICPDCGVAALVYEEGCKKCYNCGYSAC